jgi:glutamine cyclotransferase
MRRLLLALLCLFAAVPAQADTRWTLVRAYPHDRHAFTEGLLYHDGILYESTGMVGESGIRAVRLENGEILRHAVVPPPYFGEGLALWKNRLVSLTWRDGEGFVWNLADFHRLSDFRYSGEGWGLTSDGKHIIMSDGTSAIRFLDPETLRETSRISVTDPDGKPITMLNELEYVDGEILANVWMTSRIARIDPVTGRLIDWIDLSRLARRINSSDPDAVLNGIAWDATNRRLFVTGKLWSKLFEIKLEK